MEEITKTRSFKEEGLASRRVFLRSYPLRWEDEDEENEEIKEEEEEEEDSKSRKEDVIIRNKKRYFKVKALMKSNLIVVLQWGEGKLLLLRKIKTRFPSTSISSESKRIPWFTVPPKEEEEEEEEGHESPQAKVKSLMRNHLIGVLQWGEGKILLLRKTKTSSPTIHFGSNSIPSFTSHRMERGKSDQSRDMASRSLKVKSLMKSNLIMVHHWGEGKLLILRKIKRRPPSTSTPSIHMEEDEEKKKEGDSPQGEAASRDKKLYSKLSMMKSNIKDMLQWKEGKLPVLRKIKTTSSNSTLAVLLDSEHPASSSQPEKKEEVASRIKLSYSKVKSIMKRSTKWNVSKSVKV